jgi:Cft2 family RNA processing exonuclease
MAPLFSLQDHQIIIPQIELFLDSKKKKSFAFISHAHGDHLARHNKIICSDKTKKLVQLRQSGSFFLDLPFFKSININEAEITLYPAGHILGSAQILIETEEGRLLYTGDFRTSDARTAEKLIYTKCDVLIMETTFGLERYCFPPRKEIEAELLILLEQKLHLGVTPVVFAYPLGKGQEALHLLGHSKLPLAVDYAMLRYVSIFENYGIKFGTYEKFRASDYRDKVLLLPLNYRYKRFIKEMVNKFTVFLSGWGMDDSAALRMRVDRVLPYSDHADYRELISFVEKVEPKMVYTTHGFAQFADTLRMLGFNAKPLSQAAQLELFV